MAGGELYQRSENVYRAHKLIDEWIAGVENGSRFVFSASHLKTIHKLVADGQIDDNGNYRRIDVMVGQHLPPPFLEVEGHMASFFQYLGENWDSKDLVHLAAFALWRLLWIHPFTDGNGRSSRAAAYLVLCLKHGRALPGRNTVLTQMMNARLAYCDRLRECDVIYEQTGDVDAAIDPLVRMISDMLVTQLSDAV
ncbi:Fic family protein [Ideonella sp. A 288]|uniref:Fic family protein n=1 Tax=Ideonella sp. A 288 TaxID=1962181 RepID=UPI000B4B64FB|nr:Fic family protein [Ideonella sp. A 288]